MMTPGFNINAKSVYDYIPKGDYAGFVAAFNHPSNSARAEDLLAHAVDCRQDDIAVYLIDSFAAVPDREKKTRLQKPLLAAVNNGNTKLFELLLSAGADAEDNKAWVTAARFGRIDMLTTLKVCSKKILRDNVLDSFYAACQRDRTATADWLLQNFAANITPMYIAKGAEEAMKSGHDAYAAELGLKTTTLLPAFENVVSTASWNGRSAVLAALLPEFKGSYEVSMRHAIEGGHADCFSMLVESARMNGALLQRDLDLCLVVALSRGHEAEALIALSAGANPHAHGEAPIRHAIAVYPKNGMGMIETLMEKGADLSYALDQVKKSHPLDTGLADHLTTLNGLFQERSLQSLDAADMPVAEKIRAAVFDGVLAPYLKRHSGIILSAEMLLADDPERGSIFKLLCDRDRLYEVFDPAFWVNRRADATRLAEHAAAHPAQKIDTTAFLSAVDAVTLRHKDTKRRYRL